MWVESSVRPRPVRRRLEDRVQVHGAIDVRERLATGTRPLETNRGREPVGVDEQQHKVGPTSEQVIGDHDVPGGRGAMNEPVLRQRCRGVDPGTAGPLPVLLAGNVEDDAHQYSTP
jgi:hypothetical protein